MAKNLLLSESDNDDVKAYCLTLGYEFNDDDIAELRAESYDVNETVGQAVNDYLDAYER